MHVFLNFRVLVTPLTQNAYYRKFRNRMVISERGRQYKEDIAQSIQQFPQIKGRVAIDLTFSFTDKRKRDLDNLHKCFIDCIKHKLIEDDDQVYALTLRKVMGARENGIDVRITSLNGVA